MSDNDDGLIDPHDILGDVPPAYAFEPIKLTQEDVDAAKSRPFTFKQPTGEVMDRVRKMTELESIYVAGSVRDLEGNCPYDIQGMYEDWLAKWVVGQN